MPEGLPIEQLLEAAKKRQIAPAYTRHLLAAFGKTEERTPIIQDLIELLTERQLDLFRLLKTNLTGPEIARKLMVS